jgi:carbonic anhydrase
MKLFLLITSLFVFVTGAIGQHEAAKDIRRQEVVNPDSALAWLKQGNNEFLHGEFNRHGVDSSLRLAVSKAQHPKAVVLTCSDSRVPPELIFDKGLGDLFVIRVAGNVLDDAIIGSMEYAVEHLHTSLIVVMGHQNCGAIGAAVADLQNSGEKIDNHIRALADKIEQAIVAVNLKEEDMTRKALLSNIIYSVTTLKESRPVLNEFVNEGKLKVIGAVYALDSGKVTWLEK